MVDPLAPTPAQAAEAFVALKDHLAMAKPSTIKVDKKRPKSAPVRNPAFREHEGLRALQKQLNSRGKK